MSPRDETLESIRYQLRRTPPLRISPGVQYRLGDPHYSEGELVVTLRKERVDDEFGGVC